MLSIKKEISESKQNQLELHARRHSGDIISKFQTTYQTHVTRRNEQESSAGSFSKSKDLFHGTRPSTQMVRLQKFPGSNLNIQRLNR
jgi:hypothetical protein